MADAVDRCLSDGGNLMIEAATGTGKTLAYLVPAIEAGRRVIISTGTRNLQDQIHHHDLPFLRDRLGMKFTATVMKGRDNYLCRYRMAEFERTPLLENLAELPWVERIADWSRTTTSGDRAEIAELPDRLRLWRDVNARADTCTGSKCPEFEECWLTRLKRRAQQSQIVVVNHHLFFADLAVRSAFGSVLPDYDAVIFDEAHLLEEIATLYFGAQVSERQLEELARDAEQGSGGRGKTVKGSAGAAGLRQAARDFFSPLRQRLQAVVGRARFEPPEDGGPELEAEWAVLSEALDDVARSSREAEGAEGRESLPRRAEEARLSLAEIVDRRDDGHVYGMELRGRGNVALSTAPIDVSTLLEERLFSQLKSCVLTSATLAVEQKFGFFKERLGLDDAETLVVESSFDWEQQAKLFLPQDLPEPSDSRFVDRAVETIVDLLEITDGHAFLLFTSHANMKRAASALEALERWPLLVQGEGSKVALVERFKAVPRSVLCGTTSFWHGVDVPGRALSLVVIDKLPFWSSERSAAGGQDRSDTQGGW